MAKTITAKRTRGNTVWLTFNYHYTYYPKIVGGGYDFTQPKKGVQRFAIEMMGEHFANCSKLHLVGTDMSVNHCGKFSEDTIVINLDGFVVNNASLLGNGHELKQFVHCLYAGIQMGKERLTVNNY